MAPNGPGQAPPDPDPLPAQLRRIAELTEILVADEASALPWWQRAAEAGDRDAEDMATALLGKFRNGPAEYEGKSWN